MPTGAWQPTRFVRFEDAVDTSVGTSIVVTDAGKAYLKALGNRLGPHALAAELVGTSLADWFGLPTFDYAQMTLDANDEIPLPRGHRAAPGPAFVTRQCSGNTWGGDSMSLDALVNPDDVTWLVVFDTWTRNCDRHPPDLTTRKANYDNVFLSTEGLAAGHQRLMAMDHTHCFNCGRDLDRHLADIERVQDGRIYGLFPVLVPKVQRNLVGAACHRLRQMTPEIADPIVGSIPPEWTVTEGGRTALRDLIVQRAQFVADTIEGVLAPTCWPPEN